MSNILTPNANLLSPLGWKMSFSTPDFKNVEYTVNTFTMPGITMNATEASIRNETAFVPSEKLTWEPLQVRVVANENMENYLEIYDWLMANHNSDVFIEADIMLTLLTSHKNFNKQFSFTRAFPTTLGGFELNTTAESVDYVSFDVGFRYDYFKVV
jgi:hypothetical protein